MPSEIGPLGNLGLKEATGFDFSQLYYLLLDHTLLYRNLQISFLTQAVFLLLAFLFLLSF